MVNTTATLAKAGLKYKKGKSTFALAMRRLSRDWAARLGLFIIVVLVLLAIFAPYIAKYPYDQVDIVNAYQTPSLEHFFGTDDLGRDIFSRMLYGGRYSLSIGICSVAISAVCGIILGAIAGFFGGVADDIIMRLLDILHAFPNILLAIVISAALGTGYDKCIIALGLSGIPTYARVTRANILNVRGMEYIEAATSINCSNARIIARHVLPNALSPLIVQVTMGLGQTVLSAATLSFVGLGVQPPTPEWGAMLSAARSFIRDYPHMVIFPGLYIMLAVLSFNLLGDALRDALDPKLKK